MISLVDDTYFNRAWCAVEVLVMQTLMTYGHHKHLEHQLQGSGGVLGRLVASDRLSEVQDVARNDLKYGITEAQDRASVRFLARQSELLAKI